MKKLLILIVLFLDSSHPMHRRSLKMNNEAKSSYKKVDNELGIVYQQILKKYEKNTKFINALRASERLWIQFRDAEVKMLFPEEDTRLAYGSMYSLLYYTSLEQLTKTRIKQLKHWINPKQEDMQGSIGDYEGQF